jgi:hypothetical protein
LLSLTAIPIEKPHLDCHAPLPGRDDVNEMYFPSGLQRGELSLSWLKVI